MEKKTKYKAILYSRVSTVHDEQAESIDNQILLAQNYLDKHPEIELAEPLDKYCERISAKTDNRPKFQEMCERLSRGDIQYLMIKDLKRLSRSVETTYAFFNLMKEHGFYIIQLSSGVIIDTNAFEEVESNLLLGIEALFAQNTVLTQSRYGKTVHKVRCENKILCRKDSTLFGYSWDPEQKEIIIDEEKASIIRELYNRYVFRDEGIIDLQRYLASIGYNYSYVTIAKWLQEGKYVGDWTINRKGSTLGIGQGAKSHRFKKDKSEWIHIERPDLAIVDKEIFDLAQEIRLSRVHTYCTDEGKNKSICQFTGRHLFAGRVFCGECGSSYWFKWVDKNQTRGAYCDSNRTGQCSNKQYKRINEDELIEIVIASITAMNIKGRISISRLMNIIADVIQDKESGGLKKDKELLRIKKLEKEAQKISNAFIDATPAMRNRLNDQLDEIEKKIEEAKEHITMIDNQTNDVESIRNRLLAIEKKLSGWINISKDSLNRNTVQKLISRITVYKDGRVEVSLALGGMMEYQLERNKKGPDLNDKISAITFPPDYTANENVMKVYRGLNRKESDGTELDIVSFTETSKNTERPVVVKLDLSK